MKRKISAFLFIPVLILIASCSTNYFSFRENYRNTNALLYETGKTKVKPFLKAHLYNGDVCILSDTWTVDPDQDTLSGTGVLFDYNRKKISEGNMSILLDSVAIFETNQKIAPDESPRIAALSILAGADVILGIICITNPKACWGSCPTFYLNENANIHYADAEGFSDAISPSMEHSDIDAINRHFIAGSTFPITMKNEALETHCINDLKLMAYPLEENERIYQTRDNNFLLCRNTYPLNLAAGPEGDITTLLIDNDKQERSGTADEKNLNSKEEIYLNFENVQNTNDLGLIISFRQTLMTTYFIYNGIAYCGDEAGDIFAEIERNGRTKEQLQNGISKILGNIDLYLWNKSANSWEFQGGFNETGPIAFNDQILPLTVKSKDSTVRIKLVLNKGLWCLDYFALTNIMEKVNPVEIFPDEIFKNGSVNNDDLINIKSPGKYLISMPGDVYKMNFILPEENRYYDLFLYTGGYYLEWMRQSWMKDKNLIKLNQMVRNPDKYLQSEAKAYKEYEKTMVQEFWNSKINSETFSGDGK